MSDIRYTSRDRIIWLGPEAYEHILINPDSIIIESPCRPPLELKLISGQPSKKEGE